MCRKGKTMRLLDHRKDWHFSVGATYEQCFQAFERAMSRLSKAHRKTRLASKVIGLFRVGVLFAIGAGVPIKRQERRTNNGTVPMLRGSDRGLERRQTALLRVRKDPRQVTALLPCW